jgi:hypothetical protein
VLTHTLYKIIGGSNNTNTSILIRYLSMKHRISLRDEEESETRSIITSSSAPSSSPASSVTVIIIPASQASYSGLVSRINIDKFR